MRRNRQSDIFEMSISGPNKLKGAPDILKEILIGSGVDPKSIVHSDEGRTFNITIYSILKKKALDLKNRLLEFKLKRVSVKLKILKKEDWQEKWHKSFHAFPLTKTIDIVPILEKNKYHFKKREPLFIKPGMVFGTGLHETTKFMARIIERQRGQFESFFDIGTGTGILSLVALKCQAKSVLAIDTNRDCIRSAKENLSINGYAFNEIKLMDIARFKSRKQFDFIAANLITFDLIRFKKKLFRLVKPGRFLAISGVSIENLMAVKKEFGKLPFRALKIEKGKQWAAILYKRIA